jgi:hypothetical protein
MWAFIWLGLVLVLVTTLLLISKYEEGFEEEEEPLVPVDDANFDDANVDYSDKYDFAVKQQGAPALNNSATPDNATIELLQDKIYNMGPPPGVDLGDTTIYAPVDLAADMTSIKEQLYNLEMNLPDTIKDNVNQQVYPLINGVLRQNGFPMTDDTYGTGIFKLPDEEED